MIYFLIAVYHKKKINEKSHGTALRLILGMLKKMNSHDGVRFVNVVHVYPKRLLHVAMIWDKKIKLPHMICICMYLYIYIFAEVGRL